MRVITAPLDSPPHTCLVTGREDGEFCDFETDVICDEYPHVYIKRDVVESAARELGMVPASEVEALQAQIEEWGEKVDATATQLQSITEFENQFNRSPERIIA